MKGSRTPIAMALAALALNVHANQGTDTVTRLNQLYNDTRQDCGGPSRPAFLRSGVLFPRHLACGRTPPMRIRLPRVATALEERANASSTKAHYANTCAGCASIVSGNRLWDLSQTLM